MNPIECLLPKNEDDDAKMQQLPPTSKIKNQNAFFPLSPNDFYHKRQSRFTLPDTIINKLNENNKPTQAQQEEIVQLLTMSNQIRALCQADKGRMKSSQPLQQRMTDLNKFTDKYVDDLWGNTEDIDVRKCIANLSEDLLSAKTIIENALKWRFGRNSLFNISLKDVNENIGNKIAALVMTLSLNYSQSIGDKQIMKAPNRGELLCIAGHRSYFGHGTKQNYQTAFKLYTKSAELNNSDGMNHLAMMCEQGIGCIQNIEKAIKYYKLSMQLGNIDSMSNLASLYYCHYVYSDIPQAIELYKKAAEEGQMAAQTALAGLYESGVTNHLQSDMQLSIKWYRKAADNGHLEAKNNLSVVLLNGINSDKDAYAKQSLRAIALLTESANHGHAAAQNNLGHCYEFGKGVPKNECKALEWYNKAASQNYLASFVNLGYLSLKQQKYEKAFKYFLKASKDGDNSESWYYLGLMHEKGYYVPISVYLALEYFEKASQSGHELSLLKVGDCYFSGSGGLIQNYGKAFDIYRKLAMNGNSMAANNIAIMYEEGFGVEFDIEAAEMWYKKGAEKGNCDAIRNDQRLGLLLGKRVTID